jgi:hypothetical protein
MLQDRPALIWCNGSSEVVTKCAELELGVQMAAKVSSEHYAASHFELRIS